MPTKTADSPAAVLPRWKCTVDAFEKIATLGLLEGGKYELIEGDIVSQMPVKIPHAYVIMLLTFALARLAGQDHVLANFSLWLDKHNLPEPDLAVTTRPVADLLLGSGYVQPSDVRLVVEVSASTLDTDLDTKAKLYAAANLPEYWAMDVKNRRLISHRDPTSSGYQMITSHEADGMATPLFAPETSLLVSDLLPVAAQSKESETAL